MKIIGIVCIHSRNYAIGYNNKLLFTLKNDMKFFKQTTIHTDDSEKKNAVLMGYNTYKSIPKKYFPLEKRVNIIISNHHYKEIKNNIKERSLADVFVFRNILNAIHFCSVQNTIETLFAIGGSSIYGFFIKHYLFEEMYITHISKPDIDIGNIFLPNKQNISKNMAYLIILH